MSKMVDAGKYRDLLRKILNETEIGSGACDSEYDHDKGRKKVWFQRSFPV